MKWTFLNRRSGVQKLATRDSPLSGARFDPSNSDVMCDDNAEATTQIVYKQLLRQMEPMNVVDEEAHDTSSRDRTAPAFKGADDTAHQPLTSSSEADAGVQPSSPLGAHFETLPTENAILLQAANALERVEAYIEQCTASLRYFVDLGSGNRPRDFADVKRNLTNTHALMNSSAPILLIIRELAVGFRALATKEATRRAGIILEPNDQPPVTGSTPSERDEPKRVDTVHSEIEVPLEEPSPSPASQPVDPVPSQQQQDEPKRVDPGSTPNEPDEPKRVDMVLSETEVPLEVPSPSPASQPVDPVPTPDEQDEPKRVDPGSTPNEQDEQKRVDPGSTPNEPDEPRRVDMVLSKIEVPLEGPSTDSQPTPQVDPVPTEKQQDEQKRIDMVLSEIQFILAELPPTQKAGIEQGNAAVVVSEIDGLNASLTIESKSAIPLDAHYVQHKQNEPKTSDPVTQEIEALLGISTFSEAEDFFPKNKS
jgi:hypothetical protein